jgi:hypothetical protein
MSTDIGRRLRNLEEARRRDVTDGELAFIADDDLAWLVSLPAQPNRSAYDFTRWTPDDFARADTITAAAVLAAKEAGHARGKAAARAYRPSI